MQQLRVVCVAAEFPDHYAAELAIPCKFVLRAQRNRIFKGEEVVAIINPGSLRDRVAVEPGVGVAREQRRRGGLVQVAANRVAVAVQPIVRTGNDVVPLVCVEGKPQEQLLWWSDCSGATNPVSWLHGP